MRTHKRAKSKRHTLDNLPQTLKETPHPNISMIEVDYTQLPTGIYKRISIEEKTGRGVSIEVQNHLTTGYSNLKTIPIIDTYTDIGLSGKTTDRPDFQRMMADLRSGRIRCVLIAKLDRLTGSSLQCSSS